MTTATETNTEIITEALRLAGVVAIDEAADATTYDAAEKALSRMLKGWQNRGYNLWAMAKQSVTATTSAAHTMNPVRPVQILNVNFNNGSTELPMERLTRTEYERLPVKTTTGIPTCYYYDKQAEAARLYVWPLLSSVTSETFEVTYIRELADIVPGTAVDVPTEWYDAVVYGLADRLTQLFRTNRPDISASAREMLEDALAMDREGSVFFAGPYAD